MLKKKYGSAAIFAGCVLVCLLFREEIKEAIIFGIRLSAGSVIPTLFPFFVISDYISKNIDYAEPGQAALLFSRLLGVSASGFYAFVLGNVCGFPLGVRCAGELYEKGAISKEECELLSGISNNPSLAFTVSLVGGVFLGSFTKGAVLYLALLLSTAITGKIFAHKGKLCQNTVFIQGQSFDIAESVKSAGLSSVTVSSFIIFFSGIIGLLKQLLPEGTPLLLSAVLLEVGNSTLLLSECTLPFPLIFSLFGFALGFSGLSVHLQAFTFLPEDISRKKYLLIKLSEGVLCSFISFVFVLLFSIK